MPASPLGDKALLPVQQTSLLKSSAPHPRPRPPPEEAAQLNNHTGIHCVLLGYSPLRSLMVRYLLVLLSFFLLIGCKVRPVEADSPAVMVLADDPFEYEVYTIDSVQRPTDYEFVRPSYEQEHYQPDSLHPRYLPMRYVRVSVHIMNTTDTFYRFSGEDAREFVIKMMDHTASLIAKPKPIWLKPDSMDVPVLERRVYFGLDKKASGEYAIYEHFDDELYWYLHKGKDMNRSSRKVINKYAVGKDSVLNVFVMGPPREKIAKGYKVAGTNGIYLGDAIKVTGLLSSNRKPWEMAGVVAHEIAHGLGLYHAWTKRDGCDDTPSHKNNAWSLPKSQTGPGLTSNNLMDYSNNQESLTPCQIGRMHARMSDITGRQRKWLRRTWCKYRSTEPIRVQSDLNLEGARDYNSDIIVKYGATLRINSRVHLPEGAAIYVDPGARLLLGPEAVIHNDCGGTWGGVHVGVTENGARGEVVVDPLATFLNEPTR